MTEAAHAKLGPSGAAKWLTCTAAPRLEETLPPEEESEYAAEGTYWHSWGEIELSARMGKLTERQRKMRLKKLRQSEDGKKFYSLDGQRHVERYCDLVMEEAAEMEGFVEGFVEVRVDLTEWVPGGFGTADCVLLGESEIRVIDLKMGQGVAVQAEHNPQGMLYGLGALRHYDAIFDIKRVRVMIIQPRLNSVSAFEIAAEDLLAWADTVVRPAALAADTGEGAVFAPSEEACRWCLAKAVCRPRMEAVTAEDFGAKPDTLDLAEIGEILERLPALKKWAEDVAKFAMDQAKAGTKVPGWKLVAGKSNRKIVDPEAARASLAEHGLAVDEYLKPREIKALGELEKLVGKDELPDLLGEALQKPEGAPTLVPESDKRKELGSPESAAADFAAEDGEDLL